MKQRFLFGTMLLGLVLAMTFSLLPGARIVVAAQATPAGSPMASPVVGGGGIGAATVWLVAQQDPEGGFLGFSGEPDAGTTLDAIFALAAARQEGVDVGGSIDNAISYLESGDVALVYSQTGVGQASKLALGLVAAGVDPAEFATVSPMEIVVRGESAETGIFGTGLYDHALAILALTATGRDVPDTALDAIVATQAENGGWAFDSTTDAANADGNTTSMVIQALVAMGEGESDLVTLGVSYLNATITEGGASYNAAEGSTPDANSTALAVQGLLSAREDVTLLLAALASFQNADGSYLYQAAVPGANLLATAQAIPALAELAFPIFPPVAGGASVLAFVPADIRLAA